MSDCLNRTIFAFTKMFTDNWRENPALIFDKFIFLSEKNIQTRGWMMKIPVQKEFDLNNPDIQSCNLEIAIP